MDGWKVSIEQDIAREKPFEMMVAQHIANERNGLIKPNPPGRDKTKDFVIYVPEPIEVKNDYKAKQTGNVFFEVRNGRLNEASGIKASQAVKVYHHTGDGNFLTYSPKLMVQFLREMIRSNDNRVRFVKHAGDNRSTEGVIVPLALARTLEFVDEIHIAL